MSAIRLTEDEKVDRICDFLDTTVEHDNSCAVAHLRGFTVGVIGVEFKITPRLLAAALREILSDNKRPLVTAVTTGAEKIEAEALALAGFQRVNRRGIKNPETGSLITFWVKKQRRSRR